LYSSSFTFSNLNLEFSTCKITEVAAGEWQTNQPFYVTFQSKNACFVQKYPIFAADMSFFSLPLLNKTIIAQLKTNNRKALRRE